MNLKRNTNGEKMSGETYMGAPREKIPWYPTIDWTKCNHCGDCAKFCAHSVFKMVEKDGKKRLEFENKYNCVVFCKACALMCPMNAITFPDKKEILKIIKENRV